MALPCTTPPELGSPVPRTALRYDDTNTMRSAPVTDRSLCIYMRSTHTSKHSPLVPTPLACRTRYGHIEMLKELKRLGVDLQQKSFDGIGFDGVKYKARTPLDCARYYYQTAAVEFLEKDAEEAK